VPASRGGEEKGESKAKTGARLSWRIGKRVTESEDKCPFSREKRKKGNQK